MKQLLVLKFEGVALLTRLVMLILASSVLWLVDVFNFSIDVAKSVNKKGLVLKTVLLIVAVLAIIHLIENACGELNELYFELLRTTWLSLKIFSSSVIYSSALALSVTFICVATILEQALFFRTNGFKVSSGSNYHLLDETFCVTQPIYKPQLIKK